MSGHPMSKHNKRFALSHMSANQRMRTMKRMSNKMAAYAARHGFNAMSMSKKNRPNVPANIQKLLKNLSKSVSKKHSRAKSIKPNMNMERNLRRSGRTRKAVERLAPIKEAEEARLRELAAAASARSARVKAEKEAKPVNELAQMMEEMGF